MSLFFSNPLGGRVGFFAIPCKSVDAMTRLNSYEISWILPATFCAFSNANVMHNSSFKAIIFFLLKIKKILNFGQIYFS